MKVRSIITTFVATAGLALALAVPANASHAAPQKITAPSVNVNNGLQPLVGQQLSTSNPAKVPVSLSWTQYAPGGICSEDEYVYDNSTSTYVVEDSSVETSAVFTATVGDYYSAYIYAYDCHGNEGYGSNSFDAPSLYQEGSASYTAGWTTAMCHCFSGGYVLYSSRKGASASFQYTGYGVAWVTEKNYNRGTATVYLDGVKVSSVNLHNAAISSEIGAARFNNSYGTHTIKIVVASGRVDVDAFLVS